MELESEKLRIVVAARRVAGVARWPQVSAGPSRQRACGWQMKRRPTVRGATTCWTTGSREIAAFGRRGGTGSAIDTANMMSSDAFLAEYIQPSPDSWPDWAHPQTDASYRLSLSRATELDDETLDACFALVHDTSAADYRRSAAGWHPAVKKTEMRAPELWYVLVRESGNGGIVAFASLMPTLEEGEPVVYCYEIHLEEALRGTGLAALLMGHVSAAAERIPTVGKVMLTCFVSNARGRRFYAKLGYEEDASSPQERRLRGGRVVAPDYVVLSRRTVGG